MARELGGEAALREARIRRNIPKMFAAWTMQSFWFILPVFVLYMQRYNLTYTEIGSLELATVIVIVVLEAPTGALADILSRRFCVFVGYACFAAAMFFMVFASDYVSFLVGYTIWGTSDAFISGAETSLVFDSLKATGQEAAFTRVTSRRSLLQTATLIIGTVVGPMAYLIDPRLPVALMGACWAGSALVVLTMEEPPMKRRKRTFHEYALQIKDGFKELRKNRTLLLLVAFAMGIVIPLNATKEITEQPYLLSCGFTIAQFSVIVPVMYGLASLFGGFSDRIKARLGVRGSFVFLLVAEAGGFVVMGLFRMPWIIAIKAAMLMARDYGQIIMNTHINENLDSPNRATTLSCISMVNTCIAGGSYLAFGILTDLASIPAVLFIGGIMTIAIAGLSWAGLRRQGFAAQPAAR